MTMSMYIVVARNVMHGSRSSANLYSIQSRITVIKGKLGLKLEHQPTSKRKNLDTALRDQVFLLTYNVD